MPNKKEKDKEKDKEKNRAIRTYVNADKINERHKRRVNLMSHSDSERGRRAKDTKSHDSYGAVVTLESGKGKKVKVRNTQAKTHSNRGGTMRKSNRDGRIDPQIWEQLIQWIEQFSKYPNDMNAKNMVDRLSTMAGDDILNWSSKKRIMPWDRKTPLERLEDTRLTNNLDFSDLLNPNVIQDAITSGVNDLTTAGLNSGVSGVRGLKNRWNNMSPTEKLMYKLGVPYFAGKTTQAYQDGGMEGVANMLNPNETIRRAKNTMNSMNKDKTAPDYIQYNSTTKRLAKRAIPASSTKHSNKYFK